MTQQNQSTSDGDVSGTDTDWIANCHACYGVGYTPEQALMAMAMHFRSSRDEPFEVDFIEHIGNVEFGTYNLRCERFVSGFCITVDPDDIRDLMTLAIEANQQAEHILDTEREDLDG